MGRVQEQCGAVHMQLHSERKQQREEDSRGTPLVSTMG